MILTQVILQESPSKQFREEDDVDDIPIKSTSISVILFSSVGCIPIVALYFIDPGFWFPFRFLLFQIISIIYIPMISFQSIDNNNTNLSRERQRKNILAWKREQNQQWEMAWALMQRREKQSSYKENQKKYEFERFVPLIPKTHK